MLDHWQKAVDQRKMQEVFNDVSYRFVLQTKEDIYLPLLI